MRFTIPTYDSSSSSYASSTDSDSDTHLPTHSKSNQKTNKTERTKIDQKISPTSIIKNPILKTTSSKQKNEIVQQDSTQTLPKFPYLIKHLTGSSNDNLIDLTHQFETPSRMSSIRHSSRSIRKSSSNKLGQSSCQSKSHTKSKNNQNTKFWKATPVPRSQTSPSPFANPPPCSKKSTSIGFRPPNRSSLNIKLETTQSTEDEKNSSDEQEKEEEEEEEQEILDSEDEQWPIKKSKPLTTRCEAQLPFINVDHDPVQLWEQRERESAYRLSMQNALARRKYLEGIHVRTLEVAQQNNEKQYKKKMDELSEILARIGIDQQREVRLVAQGFEKREQERSRAFQAMISEAEKIEKDETLRVMRIKQEEAAKKAEAERQQLIKQQELQRQIKKVEELKLIEEQKAKERELKQELELKARAQDSDDLSIVKNNYEKWYLTMQQIKATVLPNVSSDPQLKTLCRQAKRRITPKVGQLTNSSKQIEKVIIELGEVLNQTKQTSKDVYLWACNHLSKALIKQAETEVTAKLSTVYPLARVVVGLILIDYAELGDVLMARLVKKCYFVTAYRPNLKVGQTKEDYRKQLGYQPESSNQEESGIQYSNRMSGIFALYIAICQTDPYDVVPSLRGQIDQHKLKRIPNQLRLDSIWCWISYMIKLPMIKLSTTPQLLTTLIKVGGERISECYGKQWLKLILLILNEGIRNRKAGFDWIDCKPSIIQLESILEDIERSNSHLKTEGRSYEVSYN